MVQIKIKGNYERNLPGPRTTKIQTRVPRDQSFPVGHCLWSPSVTCPAVAPIAMTQNLSGGAWTVSAFSKQDVEGKHAVFRARNQCWSRNTVCSVSSCFTTPLRPDVEMFPRKQTANIRAKGGHCFCNWTLPNSEPQLNASAVLEHFSKLILKGPTIRSRK